MLPETHTVDFEIFQTYLKKIRSEIYEISKKDGDITGGTIFVRNNYIADTFKSKTLSFGIDEVQYEHVIQFGYNNVTENYETEEIIYSQIVLNVTMIAIRSGNYWYVYDPMPEYSKKKTESENESGDNRDL